MWKNIEYYTPLLNDFCRQVQPIARTSNYPHGLYIPHPVDEDAYWSAKSKCFYIGRDTYTWCDFVYMFEYFEDGDIGGYIAEQNNTWPGNPQTLIEGWGNKRTFWPMILKLHIYLATGRLVRNVWDFTEEDKTLLRQIGWGNINAVEVQKSLEKETDKETGKNYWELCNQKQYWEIVSRSQPLNKFKHILDLYAPDKVFIFCWDFNENSYFEGLDFASVEFADRILEYSFKGYRTKAYCTYHPNAFSFRQMDFYDVLLKLGNRALEASK